MGNWIITVKGHGIHHNSNPDDADVLARQFVEKLRERGHDVASADLELTQNGYDQQDPRNLSDLLPAPAPAAEPVEEKPVVAEPDAPPASE